ncbi:metallophosphoesterase 1 [Parasteatoda tepidariorum]|uniref:metallophosphoesterase 1 n=1 Tax=Parasteatoda tepidariorum TaxID=114398 RepID=UPI00077F84FE|nr:cell division control protein 1 [Parasteatoda tepidariorum]
MHIKSFLKLLFLLFTIVIVFEWIEYSLAPILIWSQLFRFPDSVRILVVGDPQLLGYSYTPSSLLGYVFRWDADQYVKKTFSTAYKYFNPNLTIFLGDNFDEGEIASDVEFVEYFQRFQNVFSEADFKKAIIIPGDNDIGGEFQPPQKEFERRFDMHFRDDIIMRYEFLEFVKVNYITHSNDYQVASNESLDAFRIVLSHFPLTPSYSSFISKVIPYLQPHIIISAHDHKSEHVISNRKTGIIVRTSSSLDFTSCTLNISEELIHEIIVPTCSYRMGTSKMGYGALEISKSGEVKYTVLWLPSRFRQLFIYLFILCCCLFYAVFVFWKKIVGRKPNFSRQKKSSILPW